jgi:hypothetical protein
MDKIEQAKKLLKKAIMLDDAELMAMANQILDEVTTSEPTNVPDLKEVAITEQTAPTKNQHRDMDFDSFKMKSDEDLSRRNGVAVNKINREIEFVDDGSDKDIKTPDITLTDRSKRKPFKKIEQTCQKCGRTIQTHPSHKREWFVCDGCIRR